MSYNEAKAIVARENLTKDELIKFIESALKPDKFPELPQIMYQERQFLLKNFLFSKKARIWAFLFQKTIVYNFWSYCISSTVVKTIFIARSLRGIDMFGNHKKQQKNTFKKSLKRKKKWTNSRQTRLTEQLFHSHQ